MTLIVYKMIAAVLIFITSLSSVIYPLRKKHVLRPAESMELSDALASGIFLGAALFHMLPDAIQALTQVNGELLYPLPEIICAVGFLFFLFCAREFIIRYGSAYYAYHWCISHSYEYTRS